VLIPSPDTFSRTARMAMRNRSARLAISTIRLRRSTSAANSRLLFHRRIVRSVTPMRSAVTGSVHPSASAKAALWRLEVHLKADIFRTFPRYHSSSIASRTCSSRFTGNDSRSCANDSTGKCSLRHVHTSAGAVPAVSHPWTGSAAPDAPGPFGKEKEKKSITCPACTRSANNTCAVSG